MMQIPPTKDITAQIVLSAIGMNNYNRAKINGY